MATYSELILSHNPVVYWKLDETSGTVAADSSGNSNDANYIGSPTLGVTSLIPSEPSGAAVTLNGSSQMIERVVSDFGISDPQGTIVAYINSSYTAGNNPIVSSGDLASAQNLQFYTSSSGGGALRLYVRTAITEYYVTGTTNVCDGNTHMVAVTCNASTWRLFIDGVEDPIASVVGGNVGFWFSAVVDRDNLICGGRKNISTSYFTGTIDGVAIFNTVLTDQQILDLYNAEAPIIPLEVQMFSGLSGTTYKFWDTYATLTGEIPTDQASQVQFETDLTTSTVGPNLVKKGTDVISRSSTGGVDGFYATLEGETAANSCLALDTTSLSLPTTLSVSLWFYVPVGYSTQESLTHPLWSQKATGENSYRRIDYQPNGTLKLVSQDEIDGQSTFIHPNTVTEGQWHHAAFVCDGIIQKIFLDGVKHSGPLSFSTIPYDAWVSLFGKYNGTNDTVSGAFKGRIDEVKIYDYILSDNDVIALSNEFTP